jgi:uncharacterized membrane protein YphA (DoxX/SURF4 family)
MFRRTVSVITWAFTLLLAFAFIGSGLAKLGTRQVMVQEFRSFGYPLWCLYLVGTIELACGLLVLFPRFAHVGAGILAGVMVGAVYVNRAHGHSSTVVAPFLLLVLALAVGTLRGWGRWNPLAWSAAIDQR